MIVFRFISLLLAAEVGVVTELSLRYKKFRYRKNMLSMASTALSDIFPSGSCQWKKNVNVFQ